LGETVTECGIITVYSSLRCLKVLQSNNPQARCILIYVAERKIWPRQVWVAKTEREAIKWEASMCFCVSISVKICAK